MKLFVTLVTLAAAVSTAVSAYETNAQRMARGLPPLAPARRSTRVSAARRSEPSGGINNSCNTGPVQCCDSITYASDTSAKTIISALSLVVPDETAVGLTCHPLTAIGIGGNGCRSQPVCCENNDFNGLIVVGCSPINIDFGRRRR